MPIKRNSSQDITGLKEFYNELIGNPEAPEGTNFILSTAGKNMLRFIEMINETFKDTQLWGLTSVDRLVIQREDNSESEWYITIASIADGSFLVQYLMPTKKRPWKNAAVHGSAENLEEAKRLLIIAMNECEGWKENQELKELVKKLEE